MDPMAPAPALSRSSFHAPYMQLQSISMSSAAFDLSPEEHRHLVAEHKPQPQGTPDVEIHTLEAVKTKQCRYGTLAR